MGQLNPPLPVVGQANSTEDVKVSNALAQIIAVLNGNIDSTNIAATLAALLYQPGDLKVTATGVVPAGFLLCDGSAVGRAAYPNLFTAIGTLYGIGDGSTTFNVPDCRGRVVVGVGTGPGLTARALGATGGEEAHVLTAAETAALTSSVVQPSAGQEINGAFNASTAQPGTNFAVAVWSNQTVATNGGGGSHNNMQPYVAANVFIKT